MKNSLLLTTLLLSLVFASCNQSAQPATDQNANTDTNVIDNRDNRPPQTIDKYLMRLDEAASLTDEQKTAITDLLQEANFEGLQRAEQRKLKGELNAKITRGIMTPEQEQAWQDYLIERRERNQSRDN
ncbi:MAG: hypothetical protein AAFR36_01010 [Bacteroidota bacterium]